MMDKQVLKNRLSNKNCLDCDHCIVLVGKDYFDRINNIMMEDITGLTKEDIKEWVIHENDLYQCVNESNTSIHKMTLIPRERTCKYWKKARD